MKTEIDIFKKWFQDGTAFTEAMILNAISDALEEGKTQQVKSLLPEFEKNLEQDDALITEAVSDVIAIARLNENEQSQELIRKQFVVINRQDINEE